jgi:hypothetical protein
MNEDFMRQFQKMPDSILLEKIHVRLAGKERKHRIKQYFTHSVMTLIFVFGVLMIFSSAVRAEVLRTFQPSRGFTMCDLNSDIIYQDGWYCATDGILTSDPSKYLSLEDAQVHSISPIILPTYIPKSFERRAEVEFFDVEFRDLPHQPTLVVTWQGKNQLKLVKLLISHNAMELEDYARMLGRGAIEETVFEGKPAIIVRGVWNIGVRNRGVTMTALMWRYDENTVYSLLSQEQAVPLDELIKMAESIP